jgi:Family of unknown function (DUF5678)
MKKQTKKPNHDKFGLNALSESLGKPKPPIAKIQLNSLYGQFGKLNENTKLQAQIKYLTERHNKLESFVKEIKEMFDPTDLPELGEYEKWLASVPAISEFRGKNIAFVEGKGVIAFADSLDELMDIINTKKFKKSKLIIGFVPTCGFYGHVPSPVIPEPVPLKLSRQQKEKITFLKSVFAEIIHQCEQGATFNDIKLL